MGHAMIMGRRTFDSIGRVLPGRRTIVVTRDLSWQLPDVLVAHSVDEAIALAAGDADPSGAIMVVGGGEIYRQTLPRADRLEITHVDSDADGDTVFPPIDPGRWRPMVRVQADGYRFVTYRREPART